LEKLLFSSPLWIREKIQGKKYLFNEFIFPSFEENKKINRLKILK